MIGWDVDGIITEGLVPGIKDVIITGRSYEEAPETIEMLHSKYIFNAIYFNPIPFENKSTASSAIWKATMIRMLNVTTFYEDELKQQKIIIRNLQGHECIVRLIK